jgi:small subunit ribosomal protein S5
MLNNNSNNTNGTKSSSNEQNTSKNKNNVVSKTITTVFKKEGNVSRSSTNNSKEGYISRGPNSKEGYASRGPANSKEGHISKSHNSKEGYVSRGPTNTKEGYVSRGPNNSKEGYVSRGSTGSSFNQNTKGKFFRHSGSGGSDQHKTGNSGNYRKGGNKNFRKSSDYKSYYQYPYSKVILTKRVDKVISGGRNSSFVAIVVVGNCVDRVGLGYSDGKTIIDAISHAKQKAMNRVIIPSKIKYIKHKFCASTVIITRRNIDVARSANYLSTIFKACGMKNVSCKIIGSTNTMNAVFAVFDALSKNIQHRRNIISLKKVLKQQENTTEQ